MSSFDAIHEVTTTEPVFTTCVTASYGAVQQITDSTKSKSSADDFAHLSEEDIVALRRKSTRLSKFAPFNLSHGDDLFQELAFVWSKAKVRLDLQRGSMEKLRTKVVNRAAVSLLRSARAKKRNGTPTLSIDGQGTKCPFIFRDRRRPIHDVGALTAEQEVDLKLDLATLQKSLPPTLNALCELLKQRTVAQISRELGIPASTVSSQVSQIRRRFESARFLDFL